ncbi:reverse transcriptase [Phytophthora megakarya]|uniref:Reverse transcriptase n=1 Tax=Phytophthora megakarya TaxID=4795 RepID=A0A225UKF4_9STRA|nr:reverse transcriptase [Phytophthora megakarya]
MDKIIASRAENKSWGLGVPNLRTELLAMSATTVRSWAITENELVQWSGDMIQTKGAGQAEHLIPVATKPRIVINGGL